MVIVVDKKSLCMDGFIVEIVLCVKGIMSPTYVWYLKPPVTVDLWKVTSDLRLKQPIFCRIFSGPDFSRVRAAQEQGTSARRRSILLLGLNNTVPVSLWLAFGEEHQTLFFVPHFDSL